MKDYNTIYKKHEEELNLFLIKESLETKHKSDKDLIKGVKKIFKVTTNEELEDILWQGNGYEKEWFKKAIQKMGKTYHKELGENKINAKTKMTSKLKDEINHFVETNMYNASADIIAA